MVTVVPNKQGLEKAVSELSLGSIVIFPCETVYGVAVDSQNPEAVKKLNEYKKRPFGKPYAIMCDSKEMASQYVHINEAANNLYDKFLPGPITVVSKGKNKVAPGVQSEAGTLGVRIPDFPFMIELIKSFGRPIVATSANASYQKRPYKISDIFNNISRKQKNLIGLVIDAGDLPKNEPSTVIDTTADDTIVLRQGDFRLSDKNEVLSRSEENTQNAGKEIWQKYESYQGKRAVVFALTGEMGAGKTQFTKGLAKAMGISELVTSPTYAVENEYVEGAIKLFHFDAWRLENNNQLTDLGFSDLIKNKSVISIEWADRVNDEIKKYDEEAVVIWINIKSGKNNNDRLISWGVL